MKVYLVEDCGNSPGRIYAVMKNEEDAVTFAEETERWTGNSCQVVPRTLYRGQPPHPGYCE